MLLLYEHDHVFENFPLKINPKWVFLQTLFSVERHIDYFIKLPTVGFLQQTSLKTYSNYGWISVPCLRWALGMTLRQAMAACRVCK